MDQQQKKTSSLSFILFAVLHLLCCGLPLLLLAGVSFKFVSPVWPVAGGILIALSLVGFIWYARRGCATCPRNEGGSYSVKQK